MKNKKFTNDELEKELIKSFDLLDKTKDACKVVISQSTQVPDVNSTNALIRSSMETMDTCDLCKFFVINRSPNTKTAIIFAIKVLKNTLKETKKCKEHPYCKDISKYCYKTTNETLNHLEKLRDGI